MAPKKTLILLTTLFGALLAASAQPSMHTILTNGPVSNRLNIVVLSEGYTTNQLGQFLVDSTNAINTLLSQQPYQEYRNYVNAFAIAVASNQSGSDHPSYPMYRDTYFNSTYDAVSDVLITIPTNSTGQGKVDDLLQTFMPKCHLPVLLVNDLAYGGSDGFDKTAIASVGSSSFQILIHETGHVLANLGDEYTNAYPGFPDTEEPNTTRETRREFIKWNSWISTNTPVPTPATAQYNSTVGLFQGAHYHTTNWYRPKLNCAMNHFGVPFCEVCSEALVLAVYDRVRPVDAFVPATTNLSVSTTQTVWFHLAMLEPLTHHLTVQWFTNGMALGGETNASFTLSPLTLGNGTHVISAEVRDGTDLVRNDPTNLLSQTVSWSLSVSITTLQLDSPGMMPGGAFSFRVSGTAPQGFVIQSSTNLLSWTSLSTNSLSGGQYWFTNSARGTSSRSFFRALTP